ncbi:MAG: histidine kinase N-terminal 7TM domain-containing protein [Clostridia bacterium]|nr:histidine kinase N-terminal 7TM domain-containing protein [Clostridia bacterium]
MIYICLYIGWSISVNKRVMQVQVRKCLVAVSGLTVFWFVVRTMKYFFVSDTDVLRNLWYWYYFPMLFIPLLSVFVAMSLGKPDNYRLPKWSSLLYIPTAVCILLVLTNDFHQLVFTFPDGEIWSDKNYEYNVGYCFVIGWEIICALLAFIIMVVKCRLSQRKKYLPVLLLLCSVIYALIYASGVEWMQLIGGDVTAVQCLMFTGILESCIQCGLIQTNTGYGSLFEVGTIKAQIVDNDYNIHYASSNAPLLTKDIMQSAENSAVKLDKNTLLKSSRIDGGYVLWQEDITEITTVLERLEENRKTIAENNDIEQENYKTKVKINAVCEKNRLYNLLQKKTFCQIELLDSLMTQYESETNPQIRRKLLAQSSVIGAYIKRCGNLIFISEKSEVTDTAELSACLDESFANLELMGVECAVDIQDRNKIYTADAIRVYDFFETVTETAINDIRSVWIKSRNCEDCILFYMEMESDIELSQFSALVDSCVFDDDVWRFTLRVRKADEQL